MKKLSVDPKDEKYFIEKYRLDEVMDNATLRKNIALTLQYIHFNLDLIRTYGLKKNLKALTCKQLLISTFSVLEGIMLGATETIKTWCDSMGSCQSDCKFYFKKDLSKPIRFNVIKKYIHDINAHRFTEHRGVEFIKIAKDLRNNVHIGKSSEIESENEYYTVEFVEESLNAIFQASLVLGSFIFKQKSEFYQPAIKMCPRCN